MKNRNMVQLLQLGFLMFSAAPQFGRGTCEYGLQSLYCCIVVICVKKNEISLHDVVLLTIRRSSPDNVQVDELYLLLPVVM